MPGPDRKLVVARFADGGPDDIAAAFADSDATELPGLVGVTRRTLFEFHGLYMHLIESDAPIAPPLSAVQEHPLYRQVSDRLRPFVDPYDEHVHGPQDAFARPFYRWSAATGGEDR